MGIFLRCGCFIVLAFFLSPLSSYAAVKPAGGGTTSQCIIGEIGGFNPNYCRYYSGGWQDYDQSLQASCDAFASAGDDGLCEHWEEDGRKKWRAWQCSTDENSPWRLEPHPTIADFYRCTNEPPPPEEDECQIPAGTRRPFSFAGSAPFEHCSQSCRWTRSPDPNNGLGLTICFPSTGEGCYDQYVSTGEYCDDPSAPGTNDTPEDPYANPGDPGNPYTDDEGCYHSSSGQRFCRDDTGTCPDYWMVGDIRYCGIPDDSGGGDDGGGDDGGGGDNGGGGDDGGGDDGDGGDDGGGDDGGGDNGGGGGGGDDDDDGDGDGPGTGTCGEEAKEPECDADLDGFECAILLNQYYQRCLAEELFEPEEEWLSGDSVSDPEAEENEIPTEDIDFNSLVADGLDESLIQFQDSCPSAQSVSLPFIGVHVELPWQPICDVALMIRPFVIFLGYFSGVLIIFRGLF